MKRLICTIALFAALACGPSLYAQAKKKPAEPAPGAAAEQPAPAAAKPDAKAPPAKGAGVEAKPGRPLPFNAIADEVDAVGQSFTYESKDGKKVKNVITDKTEIKQGEAAAKLADIKPGDSVSGLRVKKNDDGTEYEIVKITKFGPKPAKAGTAKDKKGEEPKKKKE
jgi:hypothetical protein